MLAREIVITPSSRVGGEIRWVFAVVLRGKFIKKKYSLMCEDISPGEACRGHHL